MAGYYVHSVTSQAEFDTYFPNISIESVMVNATFQLSKTQVIAPLAAYSILFVIGTAGNAWVAAVIGRLVLNWVRGRNGMGNPAAALATGGHGMHIYILALCCFDLLALACLPLLLMDMTYGHWTIPSSLMCKLFLSGDCLTKIGAPVLLTALSGFCYFSICRGGGQSGPIRICFDLGSSRTALMVVAFSVFVVVALGSPIWYYAGITYLVVIKNDTIVKVMPKCGLQSSEQIQTAFMVYSCAFGYIVPAALFTYFYSAVLYHVHKHAQRVLTSRRARYFWKAAKTSMSLVIFYLSCWTPYYGLFLYIHFAGSSASPTPAVVISYFIHSLPYINCCGYPILYTLLNRNINDEYERVARRSRERREQSRQILRSTNGAARHQTHRDPSYGQSSLARTEDSNERSFESLPMAQSPGAVTNGQQSNLKVNVS